MGHHLTTCTFCGVGCGILLETSEAGVVGAYPSMSHPGNQGKICVRGWNVHEVISATDRIRAPLVRRDGELCEVGWDEALGLIADRFEAIRRAHGPDAIGFLTSSRCSNEETYLLQRLARAVIGTNNVDQGTSVHRFHTVAALTEMLGLPVATCSIADLSRTGAVLIDGADLARQMPTVGGRVIRAKLGGATLIAVGARRHRVAEHADVFLQTRPHTAVFLYGAMAKIIVDRGLMNLPFIQSRCQGYERFLARIQDYDVLWAADRCGVPPGRIEEAAIAFARAPSAVLLYSPVLEAEGIEPIQALVDLALLTGNIGKPGAGILPLAEHNNVQGGCDMGMMPDHLPGYQPVADAVARERLGALWGATLPDRPGLNGHAMLDAAAEGRLKALWLGRHTPGVTATLRDANEALARLEFVVQQHLFLNEASRNADVVLPVVAFGEERVTFTNLERRIQIAEKVVEPPPGTVPAWEQIVRFARRMGADWRHASSSEVMDEIGRANPHYAGASHENLARDYGRQWPCTHDRPLGTPLLFAEPEPGRPFRFAMIERPAAPPDPPKEFPFTLLFAYSLYYWNKNVLVQHSETLKREYQILLLDYPEGFVEIHPDDAAALNVRDGAPIRVVSPAGAIDSFARVTAEIRPGVVCIPFFLHDSVRRLRGAGGEAPGFRTPPVFVRVEKV
jgi:predicted molibdopterin-dependent oxidoreductase YjgC